MIRLILGLWGVAVIAAVGGLLWSQEAAQERVLREVHGDDLPMSVPDATGYSEPQEVPLLIISAAQWITDRATVLKDIRAQIDRFLGDQSTGVFAIDLLDHETSTERARANGVCC